MSELTVAQALELAPFARTRVVAGKSGLGRVIRSVNVMEVPDIGDFIKPKELLLTTGFPLRDTPDAWRNLVPTLVAHDVAAVAIKLNRYVHEIPPEMIAAADAAGLPVLELPPDASFNQYINPLLGEILNRQAVMLRRSEEIHDSFTRVLLSGGGFGGLVRALAEFTGHRAALYDRDRPVTASPGVDVEALPAVTAVSSLSGADQPAAAVPGLGPLLHAESVVVGWGISGYVTLWGQGVLNEIDRLAVQHAATILGLEFQRQESIRETEQRYTGQFLAEFLEHRLTSVPEVLRRAEVMGLPLQVTDAHMAVSIPEADMQAEPGWRSRLGGQVGLMRRLFSLVDGVCRSEQVTRILFEHNGAFQLLLQPADAADAAKVRSQLERLGKRILSAVHEAFPQVLPVIGIGRYYGGLEGLPLSYAESQRAVAVGRRTRTAITHYGDLGVYRLLAATNPGELELYVQDLLGPLIDYDRNQGADLLPTLSRYLETGRNARLTAERLFVHYNTVRYRIERIEQILDASLEDPDLQLALHVGIKARSMTEKAD